jgi:hypothetical protein
MFPVRYELNLYINLLSYSVFKRLNLFHIQDFVPTLSWLHRFLLLKRHKEHVMRIVIYLRDNSPMANYKVNTRTKETKYKRQGNLYH